MPSPSLSRRCSSSPFALSCLLFSTGLALLLAGACWVVSRTTRANGKASPPRMSPRSGREKEKEKDRSLSFARRRERERRRLSTWSALSLFSFSLSLSRSSLGSCCPATFAAAVFPREKQRETETGTEYLGRRFLPFSLSHSRHPLLFLSTLSFFLLLRSHFLPPLPSLPTHPTLSPHSRAGGQSTRSELVCGRPFCS